jgi:drug/metabolite transporter (DMT)-like permease/C-terminal processing protease CtpA/Prc
MDNEKKATIFALLTVAFWSTVATAFKIGLETLQPAQLIFLAASTSTVLFFLLLLLTKKISLLSQLSWSGLLHAALLGAFNPFVYYLVLFEAYSLLPAQVAQPINMVWPIVLVLLSAPLLKQKITGRSIIALIISFAGVFMIASQGSFFSLAKSNPWGIALGLFSAFVWSLYWIFNVKNKTDELIKLFLNFLFGTLYVLIYLPVFSDFNFTFGKSFWAGIYVGVFEVGLSFFFWMKALSLTKHNARIANLIYISPFLSLIFIHFVLGEDIYITTILGIVFIVAGILFQQAGKQKIKQMYQLFLSKMNRLKLLTTVIVLLALAACNSFPEPEKKLTANDYVYEAFNEWYLWYDQLPELDPNDFENYDTLIDSLKVDADRWSFAASYTDVMNLFEKGEYKGFGAGFVLDHDRHIKISHVYANSPMGKLGVERAWTVRSVNGYTVDQLDEVNKALASSEPVDFVLADHNQKAHQFTVQKEAFIMNTVLYSSIIEKQGKKIAYLVFDSFVEASKNELEPVFANFKNEQITDLIVDLRYNGGGVVDIAEMMVGMIGGSKVKGQVVSTLMHNDKKSDLNNATISEYDSITVEIDQVYFITTSGTASASELLINNLSPFMDVKLVGSNTHGKPVGMYILSVKDIDLAILPISFKNVNYLGFGDYFGGLPAHIIEADDLDHNWGHPEETMLATAVNDIVNPALAVRSLHKSALVNQQQMLPYKGINQIINAW